MHKNKKTSVRPLALRILLEFEEKEQYINLAISSAVLEPLSPPDRRFLTVLVYGTVERLLTLDYQIGCLAARPAASLTAHTRMLLRMGLYQLSYMPGVAPFAAIGETVALGRNAGERGLVNAILRTAQREPEKLALPPREKNLVRYLSLAYSFPTALVRHFLAQYGEEMTEKLFHSFNEVQPLTLRVNTRRTTREAVIGRLQAAGYRAGPTPYAPHGVRLFTSAPPLLLPGFAEGDIYVQDEASQIATAALCVQQASLVVDTCACPGGKAFGLAMDMPQQGRLIAMDVHESKLSLIREGAERLGLSSIEVLCHDGQAPRSDLRGAADAVLCDAPCSGLGVLGKKADLRYHAWPAREGLPALQEQLLSSAATYVRPGGVLVYATCTLNEAENGGVCAAFRSAHPDFEVLDFAVSSLASHGGQLRLLPPVHQTDGFFIAAFRRREGTL